MIKQLCIALFKAALTGLGRSSNTCCHLASVMTAYLQPNPQWLYFDYEEIDMQNDNMPFG